MPELTSDYIYITLSHSWLWSPAFHPNDDECLSNYQPVGKGRVKERHCCQVAESSAKKLKCRRRKSKMAEEIYGRNLQYFTKSGWRNISTNNVTSWNFYVKYKVPTRCFGIIFLTWQSFSYKWQNFYVTGRKPMLWPGNSEEERAGSWLYA